MRTVALVNYALVPSALARVLPPGLEPEVRNGSAWLSIVLADLYRLRPQGVPAVLGVSCAQVVYRAVVTCRGERGVYFVRSDANSRIVCAAGNRLSLFPLHRAAIDFHDAGGRLRVWVRTRDGQGDLVVDARARAERAEPAADDPHVTTLQRRLVDLHTAFGHDTRRHRTDVLRVDRGDWQLGLLEPVVARSAFMDAGAAFDRTTTRLDSVVVARDVRYRWHRRDRHARSVAPAAAELG